MAESPANEGFNVKTGVYENLLDAGVIDPVKVTCSALRNAASIAALVLSTETLVAEKVEVDEEAHGRQGLSFQMQSNPRLDVNQVWGCFVEGHELEECSGHCVRRLLDCFLKIFQWQASE